MSAQSALTYAINQCTRFVAQTVDWVGAGWGDAYQWVTGAQKAGLAVTGTATLGSVAVWQPNTGGATQFGHVAEVIGYQSNGLPIVQEQNWGLNGIGLGNPDTRGLTAAEASAAQYIQAPIGSYLPTPVAASSVPVANVPHYGMIDTTKLPTPTSILQSPAPPGFVPGIPGLPGIGGIPGFDPLGGLASAIVGALGSALGAAVQFMAGGVATFLKVSATDVGAFAQNHVVPLAVAGVVTAALFA